MATSICVLIPAKDERLVIGATIKSILGAGMSVKDIYVVDDGSSDGTGDIARSLGVSVLRNEVNVGKALSVKAAVKHFDLTNRYKFISMMDSDTLTHREYFSAMEAKFASNPTPAVVCGHPQSRPHNWVTAYRCFEYFMTHFVFRGGQANMGVVLVAPGCAATYRSDVFAKLDWSNDTRVEDMDVTIQVHRKHLGRIVYAPKAIVYTQDPQTVTDFTKQILRWHGGTWQVGKKYKMLQGLQRVDWEYKFMMIEGIIISAIFLSLPLWAIFWPKAIEAGLLMDFGILFVTSLAAAITDKRWDVLLCSPAFLLMRMIYCFVFLYAFVSVMLLKRPMHGWLSVKRYEEKA